jgi:hypothetical protein
MTRKLLNTLLDEMRAVAKGERTASPLATAAQAAAARPRSDALGCFLDDWEAKHGDLTLEELAGATKDLTPPPKKSRT